MVDNLKKGAGPYSMERAGAGNGARTRDPKLGKLVLYQLSYARPSQKILSIFYNRRCQSGSFLILKSKINI
jgi:hypothetical protein